MISPPDRSTRRAAWILVGVASLASAAVADDTEATAAPSAESPDAAAPPNAEPPAADGSDDTAAPADADLLEGPSASTESVTAEVAPAVEVPPPPPGTVLPVAPSVAPGAIPPRADAPLDIARERWLEGDATGVIAVLTPWLETRTPPWGRTRTSGHLLLGLAHMSQENWNLASRHFYRVRRAGGTLAPYGAWYEAKVDHLRGRHWVAVRECRSYREKWPDGAHADECLLLTGDALAAGGNRGASVASYRDYLEKHPDTPREEEITLAIALAYVESAPKTAIRLLHELALGHSFPSTDLAVHAALTELSEAGFDTAMPDNPTTKMRRAEALRRSGRYDDAWEMFQELQREAETVPELAQWAEANEERFAWGTRKYNVYAEVLAEQYTESPDAELAWRIFRAWTRDGRYDKAVEWGHKGLEDHATHHRWRAARDDMAWATLHAGLYEESADRWLDLSKRGGAFGRKAHFYSAFAALRGGDAETALSRFDALLERPGHERSRALYWRGKAKRALGDDEGSKADLDNARLTDRSGWYSIVQQPSLTTVDDSGAWRQRDGRWHGLVPLELPDWQRPPERATTAAAAFPVERPLIQTHTGGTRPGLEAPEPSSAAWSTLTWGALSASANQPVAAESVTTATTVPLASPQLPDGYQACRYFDPSQTQRDFYRFAEANKALWPELAVAHDLAAAGLYTDAARQVFPIYEEWRDVVKNGAGDDERRKQIAATRMTLSAWRPFLIFVRDHYHAARACGGLQKSAPDDAERIANLRLAYPVVEPVQIWQHSQTYNVDPYLVMGIMRQESTYRNTALSPVGAIGLIQVMPRTGARIAAMLDEHRYSPGDLEDPSVNLRYGIYYLSKLLDRFDGVFPLAVASYNGGPHNVSRWYERHQGNIELDAFVEQIEYDETRDYVKKVSGHYARYVAIYEGADARVVLPPSPRTDDASVIDF